MKTLFMSGYTNHALGTGGPDPGRGLSPEAVHADRLRSQRPQHARRGRIAAELTFRSGTIRAPELDVTMSDSAATPAQPSSLVTAFRRRLPIGVECIDARTAHVRVWAPASPRRVVVGRERAHRPRARGRRLFQRHDRRVRRRPVSVQARRRRAAVSRSGVALSAGRTARAVGDRRCLVLCLDRRGLARRVTRRPGRLRNARRHLHARRHLGRRGAASCASWRGSGSR